MTSYPGSGILTQFYGPVTEGSYGVAPSLTGGHFYAIKGGGSRVKGKKITAQGEGLFQGALHPQASRRVVVGWDCAGQIPLELPTRNLNNWLYHLFGSYGQTNAALTQDMSTGAYKAVHYPGPLQSNSFAFQYGIPSVDGTIEPSTIVGAKVSGWELSVEKHGIVQLAIDVMARNELMGGLNSDPLNVSLPGLVSYSKPIGSVFHWAQSAIYYGGTASTTSNVTSVSGATQSVNVRKLSLKYGIPLDGDRYEIGGSGFRAEPIDNGLRTITLTAEIEWLSNLTFYNDYATDTPLALRTFFQGPVIGSGSDHSYFELLVPEFFLDDAPPDIPGTQVITQTIPFAGLDDGANNPIQATYWSLDTA